MAVAEQEWAKRVRAAAAYAGIPYNELAERLGMSDSTLRRHLAAKKRPFEQRALWQEVAEITGLPDAFFTVDFNHLEAPSAETIRDAVRDELTRPEARDVIVEALVAVGPARLREIADQIAEAPALEDLTRRTKEGLVGPEADAPRSTPAAADTQSAEASTSEEDESPPAATRRTGRSTGA